ncbi:MAG: AAA family ATPase [Thermoguttaceae bacterium]
MTEYRENQDIRRAFLTSPDERAYFPASIIEKARRDAERCLKRGEGVALILGDAGVGKTLLTRVIASKFTDDDLVAVVCASRKFSVKAFFQQLLFSLHQTFVGGDETELRLMTLDYLERAPQRRRVILIDDAQNLSLRVFDELRALIDHIQPPAQLSVALFGSHELEERLNLPQLYPFAQRVVSRSWLDVFTNEETGQFISKELKRAQMNAKFTKEAKKAVAELAEGAPRVVVQLCDRALWMAEQNAPAKSEKEGKKPRPIEVDEEGVRSAWRDLQSIPEDSVSSSPVDEKENSVVEFGELDDEPADEDNGTVNVASAPLVPSETPQKTATPAPVVAPTAAQTAAMSTFAAGFNQGASTQETVEEEEDVEEPAPANLAVPEAREYDESAYDAAMKSANAAQKEPVADPLARDVDEIDQGIEARLLEKLNAPKSAENGIANEDRLPPRSMNFELVTEQGDSYKTTSMGFDDAHFVPNQDVEKETPSPNRSSLWDEGGSFDEALEFSSVVPPVYKTRKSVTRRPLAKGEDGDKRFREANGYSADEYAQKYAQYPDFVPDYMEPRGNAKKPDGDLPPEDRAYRSLVSSCYDASNSLKASDQYLHELRLLEQEIAEEANLIRRIRNIHLQLRAARDPFADDANANGGSHITPGSCPSK